MAMHLMLQNEGSDDARRRLYDELTGPLRTMGPQPKPGDENAPAWWHGEEEAYESTMAAVGALPRRRR